MVSRLVVVLLGIGALYQALNTQSVLAKTLYAYTIYSAALTPVILAAFYSRRATAAGAVSGHRRGHVRDDLLGHGAGQEPPAAIARPA